MATLRKLTPSYRYVFLRVRPGPTSPKKRELRARRSKTLASPVAPHRKATIRPIAIKVYKHVTASPRERWPITLSDRIFNCLTFNSLLPAVM
jgi:hypothetical protein